MKIRKVEIEAFRVYNELNDGTFNFELSSNNLANFVSIYAPNGFGKTSFYDAIEWSYTNRISRLDKSQLLSKVAKSERDEINIERKQEQYILKNKSSSKSQGTVNLYIEDKKVPVSRKTPKISRGQSDYKFTNQKIEEGTKPFQDVILSQEWIDAFLREDNPQTRYTKFISAFGEQDIENQYRLIRELLKKNDKEIKKISNEMKVIEKIVVDNVDEQLLDKINTVIKEYNDYESNIPMLDLGLKDSDFVDFENMLADEKRSINNLNKVYREQLEIINNIIIGNEQDLNLTQYYRQNKELEGFIIRQNRLNEVIENFKKLREEKNKVESFSIKLDEQKKWKGDLLAIKSKYSIYSDIKSEVYKISENINKNKKDADTLMVKISKTKQDIKDTRLLKEHKINTLEKNKGIIDRLPALTEELLKLKRNRTANNKEIQKILEDLRNLKNDEISLTSEYQQYELIVKNIKDYSFSMIPEEYKDIDLISIIEQLLKEIRNDRIELEKVNESEHNTKIFKRELSDFVKTGYDIVKKNNMSKCPLCESDFSDFEVLSKKISENTLIDTSLQETLIKKETINKRIEIALKKLDKQTTKLIEPIDATIQHIMANLDILKYKIVTEDNNLIKLREQNSVYDKTVAKLLIDYPCLDNSNPLVYLNSIVTKDENEVLEIDESILEWNDSLCKDCDTFEKLKTVLQKDSETIISLEENRDFILLNKYLIENFNKEDLELTDIENKLELLDEDIGRTSDKLDISNDLITVIEEKLSMFDLDEVNIENERLSLDIINSRKLITIFDNKVIDLLGIDSINDLDSELTDEIDKLKKEVNVNITINSEKELLLNRINNYKDNVQPFLKYTDAKYKISVLLKKRVFLSEKVASKLIEEKERLEKRIKNHIDSFFYQELINTLYQKIDPHPEYKEISFKCEFPTNTSDKPKLNVFVEDNNKNLQIPSLYFSAAQQNILCLSIFLAKALHATDNNGDPINCIFIDDPIQSMDSINVLSTIDLFRSIIVNLDKQIILSTHDNNFQNLLMKKIPQNLFQAKYIKLESFGKVSKD